MLILDYNVAIFGIYFQHLNILNSSMKGKEENILTSTDNKSVSEKAADLEKNSDGKQSRNVSIGK